MNIHIQDDKLFHDLLDSTFFNVKMGSPLYNLNDAESDTDFLCVYSPSQNQMTSFNKSIHQIQFKDIEHKTDYVFTDLYSFFWNLLNGDSTINFEVLHSEDYKKSEFGEYFKNLTPKLRTYSIIVAYLGFANRDIKYFWKEKTKRDKFKKLLHIERGLRFAKQIFYDYDRFSLIDDALISKKKIYDILLSDNAKETENIEVYKTQLEMFEHEIKAFRQDVLNVALEKKEIRRFLSVKEQIELDDNLLHFSNKPTFCNKQKRFMSIEPYYLVNENELKY